jgi:hypothetical protein
MTLPRCPEPTELGGFTIEEIRRRLREEMLPYANIPLLGSQGLPRYLWTVCDWKSPLKELGMNWQVFLKKIIPYCEADIKNWILEGIIWENLLDIIENSRPMQNYLMHE